jgi:pimeloyl-ACP methyl ester carboxylesterase
MATFVLVSGAWHAAWCWERLIPQLEAGGHRVVAPNLLGMGPDRTPLAEAGLAAWADQVAELIRAEPEPVILVGHSRGGVVISEIAERVPDRIARLVYLTAFLVPDGTSLAQAAAQPDLEGLGPVLVMSPDGTSSTVAPEHVGPIFYNTTEPEWVARAQAQLTPEPMMALGTPVRVSEARFGRVPRAYIECARDQAVPLTLQRRMHAALPCDPVITLDTDHSPFFSAPEALADALERISRA